MRGLVTVAGFDEARKQRMRAGRLRLELGVELDRKVPGMPRQLRNLDELAIGRSTGDPKAVLDERALV